MKYAVYTNIWYNLLGTTLALCLLSLKCFMLFDNNYGNVWDYYITYVTYHVLEMGFIPSLLDVSYICVRQYVSGPVKINHVSGSYLVRYSWIS